MFSLEIAHDHPSAKKSIRIEELITTLSKYFAVLILLTCYAILLTPLAIIIVNLIAGKGFLYDYQLPLKIV